MLNEMQNMQSLSLTVRHVVSPTETRTYTMVIGPGDEPNEAQRQADVIVDRVYQILLDMFPTLPDANDLPFQGGNHERFRG